MRTAVMRKPNRKLGFKIVWHENTDENYLSLVQIKL